MMTLYMLRLRVHTGELPPLEMQAICVGGAVKFYQETLGLHDANRRPSTTAIGRANQELWSGVCQYPGEVDAGHQLGPRFASRTTKSNSTLIIGEESQPFLIDDPSQPPTTNSHYAIHNPYDRLLVPIPQNLYQWSSITPSASEFIGPAVLIKDEKHILDTEGLGERGVARSSRFVFALLSLLRTCP
jgi:hypothetical protein